MERRSLPESLIAGRSQANVMKMAYTGKMLINSSFALGCSACWLFFMPFFQLCCEIYKYLSLVTGGILQANVLHISAWLEN